MQALTRLEVTGVRREDVAEEALLPVGAVDRLLLANLDAHVVLLEHDRLRGTGLGHLLHAVHDLLAALDLDLSGGAARLQLVQVGAVSRLGQRSGRLVELLDGSGERGASLSELVAHVGHLVFSL